MRGRNYLLGSVLLISVIGALALTTSSYVACKDFYPDEFLDLGLLCQHPIFPVFAPHLNTHPALLPSLNTYHLQKANLLTTFMRC